IARLVALAVLVVLCVLTPGVAWVVPFWLPFVPTALWNTLVRAVAARPSRQNVRIVYDGDCGFCQAGAHIVRVLCAFPLDAVKSANTDADLLADMTARDSWILVLPDGSRRYRFAAVIHLLSITPWWWPVSMVLRIPPLPWLGDRWYRHIARNRLAISRRARWLVTFRPYTADALPRSLRWAPLAIALTALFWMAVARLQ
ncbi:MAG: thiol-disulfide oxidoreductase DCC family protein, partial [Planctomycetota bacterium]